MHLQLLQKDPFYILLFLQHCHLDFMGKLGNSFTHQQPVHEPLALTPQAGEIVH